MNILVFPDSRLETVATIFPNRLLIHQLDLSARMAKAMYNDHFLPGAGAFMQDGSIIFLVHYAKYLYTEARDRGIESSSLFHRYRLPWLEREPFQSPPYWSELARNINHARGYLVHLGIIGVLRKRLRQYIGKGESLDRWVVNYRDLGVRFRSFESYEVRVLTNLLNEKGIPGYDNYYDQYEWNVEPIHYPWFPTTPVDIPL